jgi:hypothetical protein
MVSLPEGNMSDASSGLPKKRPPLRGRHVLYLILGVVGFAYVSAPELWAPWVYFTGGSFHVVPWWSGTGSFAGPDGKYQLYLYLSPMNTGSHPTLRTALDGDGHLCTPSGERLVLHVEGDMDKHLPSNTLGRSIEISSFARSKPGSFSAMQAPGSPYVRLTGVWGPGRIEAKGTLEHQPAAPGHPAPPKPTPITVTLQQSGEWWPPACRMR